MEGCQNHGPLLGPLNTRCRVILRTQKGTIILTTTHMASSIGREMFTTSLQASVSVPNSAIMMTRVCQQLMQLPRRRQLVMRTGHEIHQSHRSAGNLHPTKTVTSTRAFCSTFLYLTNHKPCPVSGAGGPGEKYATWEQSADCVLCARYETLVASHSKARDIKSHTDHYFHRFHVKSFTITQEAQYPYPFTCGFPAFKAYSLIKRYWLWVTPRSSNSCSCISACTSCALGRADPQSNCGQCFRQANRTWIPYKDLSMGP